MNGLKAAILSAIRDAGMPSVTPEAIAAEADALLLDLPAVRPRPMNADVVAAFAARVVSPHVNATLDRIADLQRLPSAVALYLTEQGLPQSVWLQPDPILRALPWSLSIIDTPIQSDQVAAVGMARYGIAETGSLVFHSGRDTAVLGHFFPLHHIAVVRAATILPYLEDYAVRAGLAPRNLNLITGASGTTDIEGQLVRGAHGPRYLHVILIEDSAQ